MSYRLSFVVSKAAPEIQAWIRQVHTGIEDYFPLPEITTLARERRIAEWKAFDFLRRPFEEQWGKRFEKIFRAAGVTIATLYRQTGAESFLANAIDRELIAPFRAELPRLQAEVAKVYLRRIDRMVKAEEFDEVTIEDIPPLQTYFSQVTASKVTRVSVITQRIISRIIEAGVREGTSISDIATQIQNSFGFSRYRAFLIARTEVIQVANASTHYGVERFYGSDGMTKSWLATNDRRTRDTHRKAGATQKGIPYETPFEVGGAQLRFPGDGSLGAPAREIIQCRCTALYHADLRARLSRR